MTKYPTETQIRSAYRVAKERYALLGVDTDKALEDAGDGVVEPALLAGR